MSTSQWSLLALLVSLGVFSPTGSQSRSTPTPATSTAICEFIAPTEHRQRFAGLCDGRAYAKVSVSIHDEQTLIADLHQRSTEASTWNDSKKLLAISLLKKWANMTVDELKMNASFAVYNPDGKIVVECIRPLSSKAVKCT